MLPVLHLVDVMACPKRCDLFRFQGNQLVAEMLGLKCSSIKQARFCPGFLTLSHNAVP